MSEFVTKDSGKRVEYPTGMRRDTQEGKPDYTLVDYDMLTRWAELMTRGAEKYGRNNWQLAATVEEMDRFKASAFRHMMQYLMGVDDGEDHAAAVYFNIAASEYVKRKLEKTPSETELLRHENHMLKFALQRHPEILKKINNYLKRLKGQLHEDNQ
jgi:hypothetical protein